MVQYDTNRIGSFLFLKSTGLPETASDTQFESPTVTITANFMFQWLASTGEVQRVARSGTHRVNSSLPSWMPNPSIPLFDALLSWLRELCCERTSRRRNLNFIHSQRVDYMHAFRVQC
jgi:hypothetical protein